MLLNSGRVRHAPIGWQLRDNSHGPTTGTRLAEERLGPGCLATYPSPLSPGRYCCRWFGTHLRLKRRASSEQGESGSSDHASNWSFRGHDERVG